MAEPRTLTDADIQAIVDALKPSHICHLDIDPEEFEQLWPTVKGMAENIQTAQKISYKIFITAIIITVFGWIFKGFIQWLVTLVKTGQVPR